MSDLRYSRQILLPEVGARGQEALKKARVICIGVGGLGCPAAMYLVAAGVGTVGLMDADTVEETNLHRQVLFGMSDIGKPKAVVAAQRLKDNNPNVTFKTYHQRLDSKNALKILSEYDIVIDGTDNFTAKFLINDATQKLGMPMIYGSVLQFEGQVSVFWRGHSPCYRCLYKAPPKSFVPNCAEAGVFGAVAGVIGSLQASEALKIIIGGSLVPALGKLLVFDFVNLGMRTLSIASNPNCLVCSREPNAIELIDLNEKCDLTIDRTNLTSDDFLIDVRTAEEWTLGALSGAIHWPLAKIMSGLLPPIPSGKRPVFYCRSGQRSRSALNEFMRLNVGGAAKAVHLKGGIVEGESLRVDLQ